MRGGVFISAQTLDFPNCINLCDKTQGCIAASWRSRTCYLKKSLQPAVAASGVDTAVLSSLLNTPALCPGPIGQQIIEQSGRSFTIACDTDYPGGDLTNKLLNSFGDCIAWCDKTTGCQAAIYHDGRCWLKKKLMTSSKHTTSQAAVLSSLLNPPPPPPLVVPAGGGRSPYVMLDVDQNAPYIQRAPLMGLPQYFASSWQHVDVAKCVIDTSDFCHKTLTCQLCDQIGFYVRQPFYQAWETSPDYQFDLDDCENSDGPCPPIKPSGLGWYDALSLYCITWGNPTGDSQYIPVTLGVEDTPCPCDFLNLNYMGYE